MAKTAFANRTNAYTFLPEELVIIRDPQHPLYDPRVELPLDENQVKNFMAKGFFGTIVITKIGDSPVVVDGRRRTMHAAEANRRLLSEGKEPIRISATIQRGDGADLFGVLISANEGRLDDTPLAKARKCARYLAMGRSIDDAALTFGVSKTCINGWMRGLSCTEKVLKAVEKNRLSFSAATELASLDHEAQDSALATMLEGGAETGDGETPVSGSNGTKKPSTRDAAKAAGKTRAKMRSRKEIKEKLEESGLSPKYREALEWVLGE